MSFKDNRHLSFIVLGYAGHGSAQAENYRHGGQHFRYLNVTGRWSARGTMAVPLLKWSTVEEAAAAAVVASEARKADIRCSSIGGDSYDERPFVPFGDQHAAALLGYLPYGDTKARELAEQRAKTLDFARAVLRVHRDTTVEQVRQLEESEGRLLLQEYRTSVFAARQCLTGKKAAEVLRMLQSGELEADHELSAEDLGKAIEVAKVYESVVHLASEARETGWVDH